MQGASLLPVLRDPSGADGAKAYALTVFPRCGLKNGSAVVEAPWAEGNGQAHACMGVARNDFEVMGYAMRTDDCRCIEWRRWNASCMVADWGVGGPVDTELDDHRHDRAVTGAGYFDFPHDFVNIAHRATWVAGGAAGGAALDVRAAVEKLASTLKAAYATTGAMDCVTAPPPPPSVALPGYRSVAGCSYSAWSISGLLPTANRSQCKALCDKRSRQADQKCSGRLRGAVLRRLPGARPQVLPQGCVRGPAAPVHGGGLRQLRVLRRAGSALALLQRVCARDGEQPLHRGVQPQQLPRCP